MEIKHMINHIKFLTSLDGSTADFERHLGHAAEELGEVAKAKRILRYLEARLDENNPETKADVELAQADLVEETVDLAITAFATFISAGGKPDQFYDTFMRKCAKWENNVKHANA